ATVTDPALAAAWAGPVTVAEGVAFSGTLATFTDPHADDAGAYRATIDWGDGSTAEDGSVVAGITRGSYLVLGSHVYAEQGSYAITVTLQDGDGHAPTAASARATVTGHATV